MSCILSRCTYDKKLEMIQPLVQEFNSTFCVSDFGPLVAKPRIRLDRNLVCELLFPSGTKLQVNSSSSYETCPANGRRRQTPRDCIGSTQVSQKAENSHVWYTERFEFILKTSMSISAVILKTPGTHCVPFSTSNWHNFVNSVHLKST
jgi:hypothetical protein